MKSQMRPIGIMMFILFMIAPIFGWAGGSAGGGGSEVNKRLLDLYERDQITQLDPMADPAFAEVRSLIDRINLHYVKFGSDLLQALEQRTKWYTIKNPLYDEKFCKAKNLHIAIKGKIVACQFDGIITFDEDWYKTASNLRKKNVQFHELVLYLAGTELLKMNQRNYVSTVIDSETNALRQDIVRGIVSYILELDSSNKLHLTSREGLINHLMPLSHDAHKLKFYPTKSDLFKVVNSLQEGEVIESFELYLRKKFTPDILVHFRLCESDTQLAPNTKYVSNEIWGLTSIEGGYTDPQQLIAKLISANVERTTPCFSSLNGLINHLGGLEKLVFDNANLF